MARQNRKQHPHAGDRPEAGKRRLPANAEAALRKAGVWNEQFERELETLDATTFAALSVIGAWDDLDWDEAEAALYEIRHRNPPSPPVEFPW